MRYECTLTPFIIKTLKTFLRYDLSVFLRYNLGKTLETSQDQLWPLLTMKLDGNFGTS